jgi:hypothetical protein
MKDDSWLIYGAAAAVIGGALLFLPNLLKQKAGGKSQPCETCGKTEEEKPKECGCNSNK